MDLTGFIQYVEKSVSDDGSIQLQIAINTFWKQKRPSENSVVAALEATNKYIVTRSGAVGNLIIKKNPDYKKKSWEEKHPTLDRLRTGGITAAFSLIVGISLYLLTTHKQSLKEIQQDQRIERLSDSLTKLQKHIDSAQQK